MNKLSVALSGLVVGIGVTGWFALRSPAKPEPPTSRRTQRSVVANAVLATTRESLSPLPAKAYPDPIGVTLPSSEAVRDPAQDSAGEPTVADDSMLVNNQRISREELTFRLETQFREEGPSDRGGRDLERSISEQFGQSGFGAALNAAECRNRLCRIDLTAGDKYAASKAFEGLYRGALVGAGGALAPSYDGLPDGRVRLVIYVARRGEIELL